MQQRPCSSLPSSGALLRPSGHARPAAATPCSCSWAFVGAGRAAPKASGFPALPLVVPPTSPARRALLVPQKEARPKGLAFIRRPGWPPQVAPRPLSLVGTPMCRPPWPVEMSSRPWRAAGGQQLVARLRPRSYCALWQSWQSLRAWAPLRSPCSALRHCLHQSPPPWRFWRPSSASLVGREFVRPNPAPVQSPSP